MKIRSFVSALLAFGFAGMIACGGAGDIPIEEAEAVAEARAELTLCPVYDGEIICGGLPLPGGGGQLDNLSCCVPPGSRSSAAQCPGGTKTAAGNCRCDGSSAQQDSCERANANQGFICGNISNASSC